MAIEFSVAEVAEKRLLSELKSDFFVIMGGRFVSCSILILTLLSIYAGNEVLAFFSVPTSEYNALKDLYDANHGDAWNWQDPSPENGYIWNFSTTVPQNPCNVTYLWQGINCTSSCIAELCHIGVIYLKDFNLNGTLPESISNFTHLQVLNLSSNFIHGPIPSTLTSMISLQQINFHSNSFTGAIPDDIGSLGNLSLLNFHSNILIGKIPHSIGMLRNLQTLQLAVNNLTGSIPSSIGNMSSLVNLYLYENQLTGNLPETIGQMSSLQTLELNQNYFRGTLPLSFQHLSSLTLISLDTNNFTGPLPVFLTKLTNITTIDFSRNKFCGTIPEEFGNMPYLNDFELNFNLLTGTISASLGNLRSLQYLLLQDNSINGSIPTSFANLQSAVVLKFNNNYMTGTIPAFLGNLSLLETLYFSWNQFRGTIPGTLSQLPKLKSAFFDYNNLEGPLFGNWTNLQHLSVVVFDNNRLTGSIDDSFCTLSLKQFTAANNSLTGTLPTCTASTYNKMEIFSVQNNSMGGTLPITLVRNKMQSVDLGLNRFSGSIPGYWFYHAERLVSLVLAINCFSGTLPSSICVAKNLSHVSIDGLHSADYCVVKVLPFYSDTALVMNGPGVRGTLPSCLFTGLPYLKIFHASGNSFTGTLSPILQNSSILSLILSNNLLGGRIPESIWIASTLKHIDLSFNEFRDDLQSLPVLSSSMLKNYDGFIHLQDNRLSGNVPAYLLPMMRVDILQGNLFACNSIRSNLPDNDPVYHSYSCDSNSMENALIVYSSGFILLLLVICVCCVAMNWSEVTDVARAVISVISSQFADLSRWFVCSDIVLGNSFLMWMMSNCSQQVKSADQLVFREVGGALVLISKIKLFIFVFAICVLLPFYLILSYAPDRFEIDVYEHRYLWRISGLYVQGGVVMFIFLGLFIVMQSCISSFLAVPTWYIWQPKKMDEALAKNNQTDDFWEALVQNIEKTLMHWLEMLQQKGTWSFLFVVVLNTIIVIAINVAYVTSISANQYTPNDITVISAAMSVFKAIWIAFLWGLATSEFMKREYGLVISVHALIMFSLFNNILVPFLAEAFVSPNCFLYLITAAPKISISTLSLSCKTSLTCKGDSCDPVTACPSPDASLQELEGDGATFLTLSYTPPFHYSYQCGSTLMSDFLPVFVYRYLFLGIMQPLFIFVAMLMRRYSKPSRLQYDNIDLNGSGNADADLGFVSFLFCSCKKYSSLFGAILNSLPLMWMVLIAAPLSFLSDEVSLSTEDTAQSSPSAQSPSKHRIKDLEFSRAAATSDIKREAIYGISQERLNLLLNQIRFRITVNSSTDVAIALSFGMFFPPLVLFIALNSLKDVCMYRVLIRILYRRDFNLNVYAPLATSDSRSGPRSWLQSSLSLLSGVYLVASDGVWMGLMCCTLFWCILLVDMMGNIQNIIIYAAWMVTVILVFPWILTGLRTAFVTYCHSDEDDAYIRKESHTSNVWFGNNRARSAVELPGLSSVEVLDSVDNPIRRDPTRLKD